MQDYIVETKVSDDKSLTVKGLPFSMGEKVEVIIRPHEPIVNKNRKYPLRGKPLCYTDSFGSVAEEYWEAQK